jgi:uncharacterized membrane protein
MKSLIRGVALTSAWVTVTALPGCIESSCEEKRTCGGSPAPNESEAGSGGELTLLPRSTGGRAGGTGFGLGGGPAATGGATSQGGSAGSEAEPAATGGESAAGGETAAGGAGYGGEPSVTDAGAAGIKPSACEPNPCAHGACSPLGASFECDCDAGYEGDLCEKNIDDCTPNPCRNGGRCEDAVGEHSCVCDGRFTGDDCELPRFEIIEPEFEVGWGSASAVSADGSVVAELYSEAETHRSLGFIWRNGDLELATSGNASVHSSVSAVSDDGNILWGWVKRSKQDGTETTSAARWDEHGITELPDAPGWTTRTVQAVSSDGSVAVGTSISGIKQGATVWKGNSASVLDLGSDTAYVRGVSSGGTVIAGSVTLGSNLQAFRWSDGSFDLLPLPAGATDCVAWDLSSDGSTVLGECGVSAVRWVNGQFEDLGSPSERVFELPTFHMYTLSSNGKFAAGVAEDGVTNECLPVVWDSQHGMRWLVPLLENGGLDLSRYSWSETSVTGVSNDGVVVGDVVDTTDYQYRAFIARVPLDGAD